MAKPSLKQEKFYQYLRYTCRQWGCGSRLLDKYPETVAEMSKAISYTLEICRMYDVPIQLAPQTRKDMRQRKKQQRYKKRIDRHSMIS